LKKLPIILMAIVSFVLFSGTSGCEHKSPTAATELPCVPGDVEFVGYACGCCPGSTGNYVINSQAEYDGMCGADNCSGRIVLPGTSITFDSVDFAHKTLIVMYGGNGASSHMPFITGVKTDCKSVTVIIKQNTGSISTCDIVDYRQSIVIDKTYLPVNFVVEYYGGIIP
jgi:hypothetical protein